ncbi:MAG: hypothetical protein IPK60_05430 [Sandaracinaceae bacterium]|nr:hypothetical protein [Sandaracinaceae bacterium]
MMPLLVMSLGACSTLREVSVAYANSPTSHRQAVAVEARYANGLTPSAVMLDVPVRARFGEQSAQAGVGIGALFHTDPIAGT